jgi:hypothetical protein
VQITSVGDHVAEVHTHAKLDPPRPGLRAVAIDDLPLDRSRAAHGLDDARELDEKPVSRSLDHPPAVFCDRGLDHVALNRLHARERALLVGAHQPAVAGNVGGQDYGKLAFDALLSHGLVPKAIR